MHDKKNYINKSRNSIQGLRPMSKSLPSGLKTILRKGFGPNSPPIAYVGDTVADVKTVMNARDRIPQQKFISLAIAPPHLHGDSNHEERLNYEVKLKEAGTDLIIKSMDNFKKEIIDLFKCQ